MITEGDLDRAARMPAECPYCPEWQRIAHEAMQAIASLDSTAYPAVLLRGPFTFRRSSAGYVGVWRGGAELSDREVLRTLNEQAGENANLRATIEERAHMDAEDMQRCQAYAAGLRAELATAHESIGQAIALLNQGHTDAGLSVLYDALRLPPPVVKPPPRQRGEGKRGEQVEE